MKVEKGCNVVEYFFSGNGSVHLFEIFRYLFIVTLIIALKHG